MGYKCEVNVDVSEQSKPGTAIIWKETLPVMDVGTLVNCRAQVAFLGEYALLNIYAPSGSFKKVERAIFFSQSILQE